MSTNKAVLAIGCHPDDIEEFCGGTLLLLKKSGFEINMVVMTLGQNGSKTLSAEEVSQVRDQEAKNSANLIGANYINLGLSDEKVEVKSENTLKLVEIIRQINPLIVFTHPTIDYMSDHENTGKLVLEVLPAAKHKNYAQTDAPALETLPALYHWDMQNLKTSAGQYYSVGTIVDISNVIEQKLQALGKHASQTGFLDQGETRGAIEKARLCGRIRGFQIGVSYGEGFSQQLMVGYPTKNILAINLDQELVYSLR